MRTHPHLELRRVAHLLDAATPEGAPDVVVLLLHDPDEPDDLVLALRPLPAGTHPADELRLVEAGRDCWAAGVVVHGRAHLLDGPDGVPQPVVTTFLVDRDGGEVALLRRGSSTTELHGPAHGRLPELCRRVLAAAQGRARSGAP